MAVETVSTVSTATCIEKIPRFKVILPREIYSVNILLHAGGDHYRQAELYSIV